jgi:hypothetical protein
MARQAARKVLVSESVVSKYTGRPKAGTQHPFKQFGPAYPALHDWTVVLSRDPLYIHITQRMIDLAIPGSPEHCVLALALKAFWGKHYSFQVGKGSIKIWDLANKIEIRWHCPTTLSRAAGVFDKDKPWPLPPNVYKLNPMTPLLQNRKRAENKKKKVAACMIKGVAGRAFEVIRLTKKRKKKSAATRTVLRNTRIKWNGATMIKK